MSVIILPGMQILKVRSQISDCSWFRFIRRRKYEQKLNENDQYATQSWENESHFHYLCPHGIHMLVCYAHRFMPFC